jgi:hypothetical protein
VLSSGSIDPHTGWLLIVIIHQLLHLLPEEIHDSDLLLDKREANL